MTEWLRRLLSRAELQHAAPVTVQEARRWGPGAVERFVALGLLHPTTPATTIRYEGCDHGCYMKPQIITNAVTGEQSGVHGCAYDCGVVRIPLNELRLWAFDLPGTAKAVARAVDAGGKVIEDVPGRLVEVGRVVAGETWRDLFLARGLAWDEATKELADARRLKASAAPLVLALATLPVRPVWPDCKPAIGLLADVASFDRRGLTVDLDGVLRRPTNPHGDAVAAEWISVSEAARRLVAEDVVDGLDLNHAKARVSTAASRGHLHDNGMKGPGRRIESGSLAKWMLRLRKENLAEDVDAPRRKSRRRYSC